MKNIQIVLVLLIFSFLSCEPSDSVNPDIVSLDIELNIIRFDSIFANASADDLQELKKDYPFMFNNSVPDSLWLNKMNDTLQNTIEKEVSVQFADFKEYESDITLFFKHLKYYFPDQTIPKVVTLAEYVDYNSKTILNDDLLFVSLDNYLGKEHEFYAGFKDYIAALQEPNQMLPDIAESFANKLIAYPNSRNFLSQLIYNGKKLYLKAQLLPLVDDYHLIGYSQEQLEWAEREEIMIWQYFIQRELLYSSDADLRRRFIDEGPFTKFYLEIDNETPPRLGQFIGWQIVKAYAEKHPDTNLQDILKLDYQKLFNDSKYKP
jgi:gliding motility-associated lipoprotein GldB